MSLQSIYWVKCLYSEKSGTKSRKKFFKKIIPLHFVIYLHFFFLLFKKYINRLNMLLLKCICRVYVNPCQQMQGFIRTLKVTEHLIFSRSFLFVFNLSFAFISLHVFFPLLSPFSLSICLRAASWWRPLVHLSSLTLNSTSK